MRTIFLALFSLVCIVSAGAQPAAAPDATPQALSWTEGVAYTYDGVGNIKRIGTDVQVYDAVGRLIQSDTNGTRRNYRYDAFGNRLACTDANGSDCQYGRQVTSARNQLSAATYDPVGNLTNFDGHTYSYDAFNMQTRDKVDGTGVVREYIYTANDERIAVYVPGAGSWQWSLRDASGKVLREMTSSDPPSGTGTVGTASWSWVKDYVYREGLLLAWRQLEPGATTPTTYHYHLDHLGTPRQITDDSGRIIGAHSYHAFGPELSDGRKDEPSPTRLKYTGHERDPELDYMHARYYDPKMGRFLSVDPTWASAHMSTPQTWNRYAYVRNNPINRIDPDGRMDGNGMGEPVKWRCPGCTRAEADQQSNRIAAGTATGAVVILSLLVPDPSDLMIGTATAALGRRLITRSLGRAAVAAGDEVADAVKVEVSASKYGEAVEHIRDAQAAGHPSVVTIDRAGAKSRRAEAMKGHPTVRGKDRDEYPPAMFREGGQGSSVRPIDPSANRGCGASIGHQCSSLPDGTKVEIVPKP